MWIYQLQSGNRSGGVEVSMFFCAGKKMSKQERDAFKNTSKTIKPQMHILGGL